MVDSTLAFNIMARDLGASSVFDKVARSADNTSSSLSKTIKVSDEAAKASERLTKAHGDEDDALGRLRVAEAKLAELRANSKAKTSQIIAAENNLSKARRNAAAASNVAQKAAKELGEALDNEGKKAGKGFGSSLKKWFTGDGKSVFKQIGQDGGTVFGSGLAGALKTPVLGPALIAGVGGAVAAALPVVGEIAAAGIVAGFGVGLGALGVVFAAKSVAVKNSWNRTLWSMAADMKVLSKPFEATLLSMSGVARRTFAAFKPQLDTAFKALAPSFTSFGDQLGHALERLAPALGPLADAASATLKSLGGALPNIIGNLSNQLIELSNSVSRNPDGLRDLASAVGSVTDGTLKTIKVLNDLDLLLKKIPGGFSFFTGLPGKLSPVKGSFDALFLSISKVDDLLAGSTVDSKQLADIVRGSGAALSAYGQAAGATASSLDKQAGAAARSAHETHAANVAASLLAGAFDRQAAATQRSIDALNRRSSLLLSLSGAEIDYQQAVDDATKAVKANGKTHDINTQKGRDNKRALDQVAASAIVQRDAMLKANDGNVAAAKSATASRATYVKLAMQMGFNKATAQAMAAQFIAIPNVTRTAKLNANKADLEAKLAAAKKQLADKDLTKERRAKLNAEISKLQAGIAAAKAALASVPNSKTVSIVTKYTTVGSRSSGSGSGGGHLAPEARATGGPVTKGKPYIVGEHRPELFVPNQSGTIVPKVPSQAMGQSVASGMAGGIQGGTSSAVSAAASLANAVITKTKEVLGISSPSKVFTQLAIYIGQGFNRGIRGSTASIQSAMSSLMSKVVNLGFKRAKQNRILAMLQAENKALQALVNRRAAVADQLKGAQARLAAAVQIRDEFKKSITDAALSFNAITNVIPSDPNQSFTSKDIIARMQNTLQKTRDFARVLAALKARGLNATLYKQIAEAGVESGGALADALLGGGSGAIKNVNSLQAQINSASAGLGNTAAKNLYQAGVDAAQGLVNGLLAKTKALALASKKLADAIVAQIKRTLGIKSPSRVLEWHGSMAGRGFAAGIEGEYGAVRRAGIGLGNSAVPNARPRRAAPAGVQRIVLEFRTDGTPHMERLAREVRQYVRVVGGGDVQKAFGVSGR